MELTNVGIIDDWNSIESNWIKVIKSMYWIIEIY